MSNIQEEKTIPTDDIIATTDINTISDGNTTTNETNNSLIVTDKIINNDANNDINTDTNTDSNNDTNNDTNDDTNDDTVVSDMAEILARNPRVEKVLMLEDEIRRQHEQEKLRSKQLRQEQEYINEMMNLTIEEALHETKEEQKYNKEFEEQIRTQVYLMHDLSDDRIQGMHEYRNAWYQGVAFALFFLSIVLFVMCGVLHGFNAELTLFIAFYTAIQGTLLTNLKTKFKITGALLKGLDLLIFPTMMVVFVCYELNFLNYEILLSVLTVVGAVIQLLGIAPYFFYDPYRKDRKQQKKVEHYLHDMEKKALKEVRYSQKVYDKQERKRKKQEEKEEKKRQKKNNKS